MRYTNLRLLTYLLTYYCSFCVLSTRVDNSSNCNSSEDEDENRQAHVTAAPTSEASESATAAAATTSDDCYKVCIVAPRDGFSLMPCGHRTRIDSIQDDEMMTKKTFRN